MRWVFFGVFAISANHRVGFLLKQRELQWELSSLLGFFKREPTAKGTIKMTWFFQRQPKHQLTHQQLTLAPQTKRKTKCRFAFCLAGIGFRYGWLLGLIFFPS
jgi:hypothetical protein